MSILFTCPHCGAKRFVADSYAGQSGPCGKCGQMITIPPRAAERKREQPVAPAAAGQQGGEQPPPPPGLAPPPAQSRRRISKAAIIAWVVTITAALSCLIPCLFGFLMPTLDARRRAGYRTQCAVNMHRIGQALHSYHAEHGSFPPSWLPDESGAPAHSWRVLILPHLGEQALYDEYDFAEPWDGPNNQLLAARMPAIFGCPQHPSAQGNTSYVAVSGLGFVFDGSKTTSQDQITDGLDETILFVEASPSGIPWMSPKDLADGAVEYTVDETPASVVRGEHEGGAHVCLADGTPVFLDGAPSEPELKAMFTIAGGEAEEEALEAAVEAPPADEQPGE